MKEGDLCHGAGRQNEVCPPDDVTAHFHLSCHFSLGHEHNKCCTVTLYQHWLIANFLKCQFTPPTVICNKYILLVLHNYHKQHEKYVDVFTDGHIYKWNLSDFCCVLQEKLFFFTSTRCSLWVKQQSKTRSSPLLEECQCESRCV